MEYLAKIPVGSKFISSLTISSTISLDYTGNLSFLYLFYCLLFSIDGELKYFYFLIFFFLSRSIDLELYFLCLEGDRELELDLFLVLSFFSCFE